MTPFEAFLAFLVVMGAISVPLAAIINRRASPIGRAIADRIRRKTERRYGVAPWSGDSAPPTTLPNPKHAPDPSALIEDQQRELREMSARLEFLERLIEDRSSQSSDQSRTE